MGKFVCRFVVNADAVFHQLVADFANDDQRRAFPRERNALSRHAAESKYEFNYLPIRGEHWDFKPPSALVNSDQDEENNDSDDKNDGKDSSSSGSSSFLLSSFSNGGSSGESSDDEDLDDKNSNNQEATASPHATPKDNSKFPDEEPVISKELVDYIKEHNEFLEKSRREFEWNEASFFSQNGDNKIQYDTFRGQDTETTPANCLGEKNLLGRLCPRYSSAPNK